MRADLARRISARLPTLGPVLAAAVVLTLDPLFAVFALPEVMAGLGVIPEDLHRGTAAPAVFVLAAAVAAWICRRRALPARTVLVAALGGYAAASLVTAGADTLAPFVVGRVIAGAAAGAALVATPLLLNDGRGSPVRLAPTLWGAFALSPLIASIVLSLWSWRTAYVLTAVASAVCAIAVLRHPAPGAARRTQVAARSLSLARVATGTAATLAGAALATVLIYVPLFARVTRDPGSVGGAAHVTWRAVLGFVIAALAGERLARSLPARAVAVLGFVTAVVALCVLSFWDAGALRGVGCWFALLAVGGGLGAAVYPLASLGTRRDEEDGGVLLPWLAGAAVGLWVVTLAGQARFNELLGRILPPDDLCPPSPGQCAPYERQVRDAVLEQFQTVFLSAALCAALAAVLVAFCFAPPRRSRVA